MRVSFIIGNPTETVEEVRLTQKFIRSNVDKISGYDVYLATPYPGTKLWDWCKEQNLIPDNFEWSDISQETKSVFGTGLAYNTIKPKELEALYLETANLKPANFSEMLNEGLQHPAKTITRVFRHPLVSCKLLLKGLKMR